MAPDWVLLPWLGLVFWVAGQLWFAQIVVYPLFAYVGPPEYVGYHRFYSRRIPVPVILPGFASFLAPVALALWGPVVPGWMTATNLAAGALGLLVTVLLAIPRHNRLEAEGRDEAVIGELVRCNLPRTLSATVQAGVALAMLAHALQR